MSTGCVHPYIRSLHRPDPRPPGGGTHGVALCPIPDPLSIRWVTKLTTATGSTSAGATIACTRIARRRAVGSEETLHFFDDAVRAGKIQYIGVSNFIGWQLQKAALLTQHLGLAPVVTLQPQYNLLQRSIEFELRDVCVSEGIGILAWSPLAGGWLTGKYRRDTSPTGTTRLGENPERGMEAYAPRNAEERTWRVIDAVRAVADARDVSMAQAALAWVLDRPAVTSVVIGARTVAQLHENLGAAGLHLSAAETALLDQVSTPIVDDYPYGPAGVGQRERVAEAEPA